MVKPMGDCNAAYSHMCHSEQMRGADGHTRTFKMAALRGAVKT